MQDIEKILKTYKSRKTIDKYSYLADFDELKENEFNLNIPRYVDVFEPEPLVDIKPLNKEIRLIRNQLIEVDDKMQKILEELGLD